MGKTVTGRFFKRSEQMASSARFGRTRLLMCVGAVVGVSFGYVPAEKVLVGVVSQPQVSLQARMISASTVESSKSSLVDSRDRGGRAVTKPEISVVRGKMNPVKAGSRLSLHVRIQNGGGVETILQRRNGNRWDGYRIKGGNSEDRHTFSFRPHRDSSYRVLVPSIVSADGGERFARAVSRVVFVNVA